MAERVETVRIGDDVVMVDMLGARAVVTAPAAEDAVAVDLGGRMNYGTDRYVRLFLLAPGQAAELIAEMILAGARFSTLDHFMVDVAEHIKRLLREDGGRDG